MKNNITLYLLLLSLFSHAQMVEVDFSDKISESILIVEGKIISSNSFYDDNQNIIYTAHEVELYKLMKGGVDGTSNIYILTPGGTLPNESLDVSPSLSLQQNEVGTFLLKANNVAINNSGLTSNLVYMPVASAQSKYNYNCNDGSVNGLFQNFANTNDFYTEITTLTGNIIEDFLPFTPCSNSNRVQNIMDIQISGFSPMTIPAGALQKLTITGSGFGNTYDSQKIWFRNNSNPNNWKAASSSLIDTNTWSDTQIEVLVPDFAGTGQIAVSSTASSTPVYSSQEVTVPYAEINSSDFQTQHNNDNNLGGYTWEMSTGFNADTNAKNAFTRALKTWICETDMNWTLSQTPISTDETANDGYNIVRFDPDMSSGVLGICYNYHYYCVGADDRYVRELDIVFNPNKNWNYSTNPPSSSEFDFETVALHELGHGRQLRHMIDNAKVMHYALGKETQKRTLTQDEKNGGFDIHQRSTTIILCARPLMTDGNCATANITEYNTSSIKLYPNPISSYLKIQTNLTNNFNYEIINILGQKVISGQIESNSIPVTHLKSGVYFLKLDTQEGRKLLKFVRE